MNSQKNSTYQNAAIQLAGMVYGISLDGVITRNEYAALKTWCDQHEPLCEYEPFKVLHVKIKPLIDSGTVNNEELDEIENAIQGYLIELGFRERISKGNPFFLKGLFEGILASGDINDQEVFKLKTILEDQELKDNHIGLRELIKKIWEDGKVDDTEFRILKDYLKLLIQVD